MYSQIRIVLVNTTLSANIGAAARAMKTMGLGQLYLVEPKQFPSAEATALASGASDVLAKAIVVPTLEAAIADCTVAIATSARSRTIVWPLIDARAASELVRRESERSPVAIVFGREDRGLTNEELQLCNYHVSIPTDSEYGVLNVAAAVQVLAYEVRMAHLLAEAQPLPEAQAMPLQTVAWDEEMVTSEDMERFYAHFESMLVAVGFLDPASPRQLMTRVRRMFNRMRLDRLELNLWRGIFKHVQGTLTRQQRAESGVESGDV
jgi:tRNA (cytidine32/uridine32-2'-O)-methyltransferase